MTSIRASQLGQDIELNFFCSPAGEAWRVHTRATRLPGFLRKWFDENYEAYPVYLDLEDLDTEMKAKGVAYAKRVSTVGGVEITATGEGAKVLAAWLAESFASTIRCGSKTNQGDADADTGHTGHTG